MWQVRWFVKREFTYGDQKLGVGDEWIPAGLPNDGAVMYSALVRPEYSEVKKRGK